MKRESKAYSYEDQKWELEMRQEMLKRKKAQSEGDRGDVRTMLKEAKLSQKQQVSLCHDVWCPVHVGLVHPPPSPLLPLPSPLTITASN